MRKIIALLFAATLSLPAQAKECVHNDFTLTPFRQAGIITNETRESDIITKLGSQYRRIAVYLGDGYFQCGSVVYPNSNAEVFIIWSGMHEQQRIDPDLSKKVLDKGVPAPLVLEAQSERSCTTLDYNKFKPESVSISQRAWSASPWRTCDGIRIGMDYNELTRIYPNPFTVAKNAEYAEIEGFRISFDVRPLINPDQNLFGANVRKTFMEEQEALKNGFNGGEMKFAYHNLRVKNLEMMLNASYHTSATPKPAAKKPAQKKKPIVKKPVENKVEAPAATAPVTPSATPEPVKTEPPQTEAPAEAPVAPLPAPTAEPASEPVLPPPPSGPIETLPPLPVAPTTQEPVTAPMPDAPLPPIPDAPAAPETAPPLTPMGEEAPPALVFPDAEPAEGEAK